MIIGPKCRFEIPVPIAQGQRSLYYGQPSAYGQLVCKPDMKCVMFIVQCTMYNVHDMMNYLTNKDILRIMKIPIYV